MTMLGKRGSAVLEAPTAGYGPEMDWALPEPAPPGTLHFGGIEPPGGERLDESESRPVRNNANRYRLRVGVPGTTAGRVALAAGAVFALGVVGAALLAVRYSMLHDDRFLLTATSHIEIEGNRHLTRSQIAGVFAPDLQHNIFHSPLAERQADLQRLPWVEQASVIRLLPDHLRVRIVERTPVAFVRQGTQIGLVDGNGVLLDMPQDDAGDPNYSFPVLTGISASDPLSVRAARMDIYRRFMSELDSGGEKNSQTMSEVDVSNPEDVKALIGSPDILVHFGDENFLQRFKLFEQNLPQWKTQYPKLAAVDARYEHQLVLEMAHDGPAAPAQASELSGAAQTAKATLVKPAAKAVASRPAVKHLKDKAAPAVHRAAAHGTVKR
ncbi:MAG TPA: FtsQ-type POTRA domain-containing protein [Acidobacteriaceae bacterium]